MSKSQLIYSNDGMFDSVSCRSDVKAKLSRSILQFVYNFNSKL